jgi:hypothetical protein
VAALLGAAVTTVPARMHVFFSAFDCTCVTPRPESLDFTSNALDGVLESFACESTRSLLVVPPPLPATEALGVTLLTIEGIVTNAPLFEFEARRRSVLAECDRLLSSGVEEECFVSTGAIAIAAAVAATPRLDAGNEMVDPAGIDARLFCMSCTCCAEVDA